ncbi:MAG: hypothetical protein Q9195_002552 [Heterodermia aff. obscurata]
MALLNGIFSTLKSTIMLQIAGALSALLLYPLCQAVINLYFHPLSKFPGPKLWAASRLPFIYALLTGQLTRREREFHEQYGDVIRLAPDEVAFANEQAWNEIYTSRRGHKRAVRDKAYYIGDLAFGGPFGCLETGTYHTWVRTLFSYLKGMSLAAAPRYYPTTEFLFRKLLPKSVIEGQRRHTEYANERINHRLDMKTNRPDFMTPFLKNNVDFANMSREEILSTFNFIIVGGSETTATTLTGIFNHLCKNNDIMRRLTSEIRDHYKKEEDVTIDSTHDLPYLEAVLNEGLRMCNPIPGGLPRVVPEGGDTYCGVFLPGGTRLAARTFAINRSAKYFTDPDQFVPERWLPQGERPVRYDNDQLSASKPFSVGFHSCLGRPLAWAELRLVTTRLLWVFDFAEEPTQSVDFDDFPVTILIQKEPMMLRVKVRSDMQSQ